MLFSEYLSVSHIDHRDVPHSTFFILMAIYRVYFRFSFTIIYTSAFSYWYAPAIFRNKLTTLLAFEQSSLARNRHLDEFVYIMCFKRACHKPSSFVNGMMECAKSQIFLKLLQQIYFMESSTDLWFFGWIPNRFHGNGHQSSNWHIFNNLVVGHLESLSYVYQAVFCHTFLAV